MKNMLWMWCLVCLFLSYASVGAVAADETLTNASVIEMHQLGLGDSVAIEKIKASHCDFDVSLSALKQLKEAGISDAIIQAMIAANAPRKSAKMVGEPTGDPNDPKAGHAAGIWLFQEIEGKPKMTKLEPSLFSESRTGGGFPPFGDVKMRAVINGAHARLQVTERKPVFYFYFEATEAGLSDAAAVRTSPNEFTLAKLEVRETQKHNERRLVVGKFNAFGGSRWGPEEKAIRPMDSEKVTEGVYRVTPQAELDSGEYGFLYGGVAPVFGSVLGGAGGGRVFDYGIQAGATTRK